jgi:hypothetical protein
MSQLKNTPDLPFKQMLPAEEIHQHLSLPKQRRRVFTPAVTLWTFLSQVIDDDQSLQASVSRLIAAKIVQQDKLPSANTSAYSQARLRLPESGVKAIAQNHAKNIASLAPQGWLWKNKYPVKLVDGSTLTMPDTSENQAMYPQMKSQKAGVGFPIMRIVALIDYTTGVLLDLAMGPYRGKKTGEHALLRQLMPSINAGDVILGDCYYPSFFLMATLIQSGIHGVFPAHFAPKSDFRRGKRLGKKDHIVAWQRPVKPSWMEQAEYDAFPEKIMVRELSVEVKKPGFRTKNRVLVTTFLNPDEVNQVDLASIYALRWFVELSLRSIKETMHMDILRSKYPSMVRKEIWVHVLAYNLIRKMMAQAAWLHERPPTTLSFKLALQHMRAFLHAGLLNTNDPNVYQHLFKVITYKKVANRPGREEPRCRKRRQKPFPLLQKERGLYKHVA